MAAGTLRSVPAEKLSGFLRRGMKAAKVNVPELSYRSGVAEQAISNWINDVCGPASLDRLLDVGYQLPLNTGDLEIFWYRRLLDRKPPTQMLPQHGKPSGVKQHLAAGEELCADCRAWKDASNAKAEARLASRRKPPRPLKPCGTTAAYDRHIKRGETPCQPCRDAHAAQELARQRAMGVGTNTDRRASCGTESAYKRHRSRGEECRVCGDADVARRDHRKSETAQRREDRSAAAEARKAEEARARQEDAEARKIKRIENACGTSIGRDVHKETGTPVCDACKKYGRDLSRLYRTGTAADPERPYRVSGLVGVQETAQGKFKARVRSKGKLRHLGTFDTPELASAAVEKFKSQAA